MTKGDWIRIIVWAVPVIFMAATVYISVNSLTDKATAHDEHLKSLDKATSELNGNQRVLEEKVGEVGKKTDSLITITDKMDDKLDGQAVDLAAIRETLKIKDSSQ